MAHTSVRAPAPDPQGQKYVWDAWKWLYAIPLQIILYPPLYTNPKMSNS